MQAPEAPRGGYNGGYNNGQQFPQQYNGGFAGAAPAGNGFYGAGGYGYGGGFQQRGGRGGAGRGGFGYGRGGAPSFTAATYQQQGGLGGYPGAYGRGGAGGFAGGFRARRKKPFVGGSLESQRQWEQQTLCCFFVQNQCKFETGCRFSHIDDGIRPCQFGTNCRVGHGVRAGGEGLPPAPEAEVKN